LIFCIACSAALAVSSPLGGIVAKIARRKQQAPPSPLSKVPSSAHSRPKLESNNSKSLVRCAKALETSSPLRQLLSFKIVAKLARAASACLSKPSST
jgi:hypothetical protein